MKRSKCSYCRYGFAADLGDSGEMLTACVYILKTGKRRPCPFGAGCTVYQPGRQRAADRWFKKRRK